MLAVNRVRGRPMIAHTARLESGILLRYTYHNHSPLCGGAHMTTDSRTWFYTTPEPRPYYIEERVNQTLWKNRLQNIFMSCTRSEEHTSELQSLAYLVCRLLLEKKKKNQKIISFKFCTIIQASHSDVCT